DPTADSLFTPSDAGREPSGSLGFGLPAGARSRLRAAGRSPSMYQAIIEPGSYLDFVRPVPFSGPEGPIERGVLNEAGAISGRAQAAVRPLSSADFARIVNAGLPDDDTLPRVGD